MDKAVLNRITESVRVRGLTKYMTHDMISKGIFSKAFSSGSGSAESWRDHLTNRDDNDLVAHLYIALKFLLRLLVVAMSF